MKRNRRGVRSFFCEMSLKLEFKPDYWTSMPDCLTSNGYHEVPLSPLVWHKHHQELISWCSKHFTNKHWAVLYNSLVCKIFFTYEEDATLFLLRWNTNE